MSKSPGIPVAVAVVLALLSFPSLAGAEGRLALGLGFGIVDPDVGGGTTYLTGGLRFRLGGGGDDTERERERRDRRGTKEVAADQSAQAWLEAEVGHWDEKDRENDFEIDDLQVGVNILGVFPARRVDYWIGVGFGLHSLDYGLISEPGNQHSEDVLGANLQTGVELNVTPRVGVFGVSRFELLDNDVTSSQLKIFAGLRFKL